MINDSARGTSVEKERSRIPRPKTFKTQAQAKDEFKI